jgi:hypothetical protein
MVTQPEPAVARAGVAHAPQALARGVGAGRVGGAAAVAGRALVDVDAGAAREGVAGVARRRGAGARVARGRAVGDDAGVAAAAAVGDAAAEVDLAAVRRARVAVGEARGAGREGAGARGAEPPCRWRRRRRRRSRRSAPRWRERHLAAVAPVVVAVGEARGADRRGARARLAGAALGAHHPAGAAVGAVGVGVDLAAVGWRAVAVALPRGARVAAGARGQVATAEGRVGHTTPQPPQWLTSVAEETSQPLPARWSQSPKPGVAGRRPRSAPGRTPACRWSVVAGRLAGAAVRGVGQEVDLAAVGRVAVAVGEARAQAPITQAPAAQEAPAWAKEQAWPQAPQWRRRWRC